METCWPSEQLAEYLSRILTNIAVVFARTFAWWHHPCEILCWYGTQFHEKFIYRTPADEAIVFANMFVWWCHAHNNYTDMALHFVKKLFHGELSTFWGSYPHEKLYWHGAVIYEKFIQWRFTDVILANCYCCCRLYGSLFCDVPLLRDEFTMHVFGHANSLRNSSFLWKICFFFLGT